MIDSLMLMSITVAAIGAGLMAGVYFAFSGFVMQSFDRLGAAQATVVMNTINEVILRSWFMVVFFGSTLLFACLSAFALVSADLAGRWVLFFTGLIYVGGMFICTVMFNVPLNNRLAKVNATEGGKSEIWSLYYKQWTRWNHLRTVCSLVSLALCLWYLANYA